MLTLPLHPYQVPATERFLERGSLMVAYEMGLGKTPIAIACAEELLGCGDIQTCLLVVPASLMYQWAQSLARFTDVPTRVMKVKRSPITVPAESHCLILDSRAPGKRAKLKQAAERRPDYVLCSYETVVADTRLVRRIKASMVVLDEASAIKNFGSDRTLTIKRALMSEYRLALTGTPVENRPEEAFSIMEWVDPDVLGSFDLFEKTYIDRWPNGTVKKYKNLPLLFDKLSRGMVRKSRADPEVAPYLPEVDHEQWYAELDPATRGVYEELADDLLEALQSVQGGGSFDLAAYYSGQGFSDSSGLGKVMSRQQAIELLLDHPRLVMTSAQSYVESITAQEDGQKRAAWPGSKYCAEILPKVQHARTPKLDYLLSRLEPILAFPENKVLIFSRWPEMLYLIAARLPDEVGRVFYHGGMTPSSKAGAVEQFTNDTECRVFLSSHAGAYGTDMHMANYLINYDLPWSGGTRGQINGRHQRVSSEFGRVFIRDVIAEGTTEERKLAMLEYKQRVSEAVVDGRVPRSGRIENDLDSLTKFLSER